MANHIRYVDIPIESIRSKDLTPEILDGMDRGEAWELYKKKNSEIVEAGAALVVRFGLKEGQRDDKKQLLAAPKVYMCTAMETPMWWALGHLS